MAEEKRYVVLDPLSITRIAESCGIDNLPDEVALALAEDATYRIRQMVSMSYQFMRRARRQCLKAKDVSKALDISSVQSNPGAMYTDETMFEYVEDGGFHNVREDLIDLRNVALAEFSGNEMASPYLRTDWFSSNGSAGGRSSDSSDIPTVLMEYFTNVVSCILGEDKKLRRESLSDLRKNSKISPLIPYFVTFSLNVKAVSHDLEQLSHLLQTVSALTVNPYIHFLDYLKPLASSVLYCVLEPLTASINPMNDHWRLRDFGSRILACMVARHGSGCPDVTKYVYDSIKNILSDPTRPLCSHYGAITTINTLGISAIKEILCPVLLTYYHTSLKIVEEDTDANNLQLKEDAFKVLGALIWSTEKLCLSIARYSGKDAKTLYKFSSEAISLFGDSLLARLPLILPNTDIIDQADRETPGPIHFNGPVLAKSPPAMCQTRPMRRIDVFGPTRLRSRRMSILRRGNIPATETSSYQHSPYYSLTLRTAYIGKQRCLSRSNHKIRFLDLSNLAF